MGVFRWLVLLSSCLTSFDSPQVTWAQDVPPEKKDEQAQENEKAAAQTNDLATAASALKAPVLKPKAPLDELPKLRPKHITKEPVLIVPQTKSKKPKSAKLKLQDQRAPRRPPLTQRRASAYYLPGWNSKVHLSPAMRWHLERSGRTANPSTPPTSATTQPAQKFYPGISRTPPQKPFTAIERPPTALERYWPLLLEGRENLDTGEIIWRLP